MELRDVTIQQGIRHVQPWFGANPQGQTDFDLPAEVAGRLWCPARGVFPASVRVGMVITSSRLSSDPWPMQGTRKPTEPDPGFHCSEL